MTAYWLLLLTVADVVLTYVCIERLQKRLPRRDATLLEYQDWIRWLMKRFGIEKGMAVAGIITLAVVAYYITKQAWVVPYLVGGYLVVFMLHINTIGDVFFGKFTACSQCGGRQNEWQL